MITAWVGVPRDSLLYSFFLRSTRHSFSSTSMAGGPRSCHHHKGSFFFCSSRDLHFPVWSFHFVCDSPSVSLGVAFPGFGKSERRPFCFFPCTSIVYEVDPAFLHATRKGTELLGVLLTPWCSGATLVNNCFSLSRCFFHSCFGFGSATFPVARWY